MDSMVEAITRRFDGNIKFYPRRVGLWQLILPVFHEDGDMLDLFISVSPTDSALVRIHDCGLTLMRLSYNYEINTPAREKLLATLLAQNGVQLADGEFSLEGSIEMIFPNVMQFVGFIQKLCNFRLWQRDTVRSQFYEELESVIFERLGQFHPQKNVVPLHDYPVLEVDYALGTPAKPFYLYGVSSPNKAKTAAIALLEFQKANLPFVGIIVYEQMEEIPKKEVTYLTRNADKQFPSLDDFRNGGNGTMRRLGLAA